MSEIKNQMIARAMEIKDDRCYSFPNLICNEVNGLIWDKWCEPCMARAVLKAADNIKRMKENE